MTYYIAKLHDHDCMHVVTRILRGGLSIDNRYVHAHDRLRPSMHCRQFQTRARANKALQTMARVGGFDDYIVLNSEERD